MSLLQETGHRFIAELLAGSKKSINGIYVEYGTEPLTELAARDISYYEQLRKGQNTGYARISIQGATINDNNSVTFTGLLATSDLKGGRITRNSILTAATLVHMPNDLGVDDVFIYSVLITPTVKVVRGAYMSISIKLAIGA